MSSPYSAAVLDHFQSPRNAGDLPDATAGVDVTNPVCGDVLRLSARFHVGRVAAARFKAQGCVASIACGSWLTEWMAGKSAAELSALTAEDVAAALGGLAPASFHAAELACDALRALLLRS
jgi:nitrogen fixation protein NifU and related proteins